MVTVIMSHILMVLLIKFVNLRIRIRAAIRLRIKKIELQ